MEADLDRESNHRKKIAILGGGMAAMSAAFELTSQPDWKDHYEITLYQLGWRLGGKGASSRGEYGRIEEHGFHVWLGSYENAFHLLQRCYEELGRSREQQLATWEEAFKPRNLVILNESIKGRNDLWRLEIPMNTSVPGKEHRSKNSEPDWSEILAAALEGMHGVFRRSAHGKSRLSLGRLWISIARWTAHRVHTRKLKPHQARRHHAVITASLNRFRNWLWRRVEPDIEADPIIRRMFILLDFGLAHVIGILADDLIICGVDSVDHLDYREWLRQHGARDNPTLDSVLIRVLYDLGFSYAKGDPNNPQFAAGAAIRVVLRMMLYKGAFVWELQAGFGETVFTPLYQVLKRRGVNFQFFSRVTDLVPETDEGVRRIQRIKMARQVTLKRDKYDPLVEVNGMLCWPPHPIYNQIKEGSELEAGNYNLESFWTKWKDADPNVTLERGKNFDIVVLGISLGAFPSICSRLKEEPGWKDMIENLPSVQTQAYQIWLKPDIAGLGWPYWKEGAYIMDINSDPFDTWADMSHLLLREMWPPDHYPNSIHYFCSSLPGPETAPASTDHSFPDQEFDKVIQYAIDSLKKGAPQVWPDSSAGPAQPFIWNLLVDPHERSGEARMRAQFFRANVDPSERYVYAAPGTLQYRMKSDGSGYENLFLAGDWTKNGLNVGAMESAVMSGMQASRAICGFPQYVAFETLADGEDPEDC